MEGGSGSLALDYGLQLEMRAASCCSQICVCICVECKQIHSPPCVVWRVLLFYYVEESCSKAVPSAFVVLEFPSRPWSEVKQSWSN